DAPVKVLNGRILVPLRFISETFGYRVHYEAERVMAFIHRSSYKANVAESHAKDLATARLASILLPWNKSISSLPESQQHHDDGYGYQFPVGEHDRYFYTSGNTLSYI